MLIKRICLSIVFCGILGYSNAQLSISWQSCFGGSKGDKAYDIIEYMDNYLIIGSTESNDGDIRFNHGESDVWIVKIDKKGELIREKTFGGSSGEHGNFVLKDDNNNLYLLNASYSSDGDISYDPYPNATNWWFVKIDNAFNIVWDKIVGGTWGEDIFAGIWTHDGNIIAQGFTASSDGNVSVWYGQNDMWQTKLSTEGELLWDFTLGTQGYDYGYEIIQTNNTDYLVGGYTRVESGGGNIDCIPHNWYGEATIIMLDSSASIKWQQCYGGSGHDNAEEILEVNDGYIVLGYAGSNDGDLTGSGYHGNGDIWVFKIDFEGNIIWSKCYGGSDHDYPRKIFPDESGGYTIFAVSESDDGDVSGNAGRNDIWVFKIDKNGKMEWQQCFGGEGHERINNGVLKISDHKFIVAAETNYGPSFDVECDFYDNGKPRYWVFEIKNCNYYMPSTPNTPSGPDTLCITTDSIAIYTSNHAAGAWSYEWQVIPQEAGSIYGDSANATLHWSNGWEGQAQISVRSWNDCGYSEWSEANNTWAFSCLGVADISSQNLGFEIFPNPANNRIHCKLSTVNCQFSMWIYDIYGRKQDEIKIPKGKNESSIDISSYLPGVYIAVLKNDQGIVVRKKFIKR